MNSLVDEKRHGCARKEKYLGGNATESLMLRRVLHYAATSLNK